MMRMAASATNMIAISAVPSELGAAPLSDAAMFMLPRSLVAFAPTDTPLVIVTKPSRTTVTLYEPS